MVEILTGSSLTNCYVLQMEDDADWGKGLPLEILAAIAGGKDALKAMRWVCHSWQDGFERSVSSIRVPLRTPGTSAPKIPQNGSLAQRFPLLTSLDIGACQIDEMRLADLVGLDKLTTLYLTPRALHPRIFFYPGEPVPLPPLGLSLTGRGLRCLNGLPLTKLVLRGCRELKNLGLRHLRGMQLTSLDLGDCKQITDSGLASLKGMPLTALNLNGLSELIGSGLMNLAGMPLAHLGLARCFR